MKSCADVDVVSGCSIRALPQDLLTLAAQASLVRLAGVCPPPGISEWTQEHTDHFTACVINKLLTAVVKVMHFLHPIIINKQCFLGQNTNHFHEKSFIQ